MEQEFHFTEEQDVLDEKVGGADTERTLKVRLDKWLWAARFFKTRALARAAVEAGRVFYNGERSKPTREIETGAIIQVRLGRLEKTIVVKGLSTRRRSTDEALSLFEETEESKSFREQNNFDYQEDRSQHSPYNAYNASFSENARERRSGRFLRRSFTRQNPNDPMLHDQHNASFNRSNRSVKDFSNNFSEDRQPSFYDTEGHHEGHSISMDDDEKQPLRNDSSFPYPQRRQEYPAYRNQDTAGFRHSENSRGRHQDSRHPEFRHQDHRYQESRYPEQRAYDQRGRNQYNTNYRQQDSRYPDNRHHDHRSQEYRQHDNAAGYRHPDNNAYRPRDNARHRTQEQGHYRSPDNAGNRYEPRDKGPRKEEKEEFENFD